MGSVLRCVGGWTSGCCGSGSWGNIGENWVDEEILRLFIAYFFICCLGIL